MISLGASSLAMRSRMARDMRRFAFVRAGRLALDPQHDRQPLDHRPSIIFPLFFFAAFAGGLSKVAQVPNFDYKPGYTAFQFTFVFLQSAAFGGVFTGFAVARDFDSGFARRLLLAAPRAAASSSGT